MRYKSLVLDMNNLFWRNCSVCIKTLRGVQKESEIYSETILMTINKINNLQKEYAEYKDATIYLLFDNPLSKINARKDINPAYKHSREKTNVPAIFYKSLEILQQILEVYSDRFRIIKVDYLEADDLVKPLLDYIGNESVLLISADMDWARNISDNYHWYNYHTLYNPNTFNEKYKFYPQQNAITLFKALHGDNSDNIENSVPGLRSEVLYDICNRFKDIDDLFNNLFNENVNYPQQWKLKIKENEAKIRMNYYLCDFIDVEGSIKDHIFKCKESIRSLRSWYKMLDLPLEYRMKTSNDISKTKTNFLSNRASYKKK